ncbi:MAG: PAS domain S-box protein, partial [Polyangiaceae bacterium]
MAHTHVVLGTLEDLRGAVAEGESANRAYERTADDAILVRRTKANQRVREDAAQLRMLTRDNLDQQRRLDELEPLLAKGTDETATLSLMADVGAEERRLLLRREQRTNQSVSTARVFRVLGTLASFALLLYAFTRLRRALGQRERKEHDLDQFFELSHDLICIAGFDGKFKRLSPSWMTVLGWSEVELLSRPSIDFVHPDDRAEVLQARSELSAGSKPIAITNRYLCKDGTHRWLEWRSASAVDRGLVYAGARDVTERRIAAELHEQTRNQLLFADRMASVGTLAAGMAHEVNNPLAYVMANLDMIITHVRPGSGAPSLAQTKELSEMAIEARQGVERVNEIVRGLKTFARLDEERRNVIELRPVLELSVKMAINEV